MVNRVSTSGAAFLACLAGCLASVTPAAIAGDKIEFSPAPDALAVPQTMRAARQNTAAMIRDTLSKHRAVGSDFNGAMSGNFVTIVVPTTTSKTHDRFGWTAPFEVSQDEESDSTLDLSPAKKSGSTLTNSGTWSVSTEKDSSFSKESIWAKDMPWAQPEHGVARFGLEESLKSSDQNDGWLSRKLDHHSPGQDWSREFSSSRSKDPMRSGYEGYGQSREDYYSAYNRQPFFGAFSQSEDGAGDAMRMPGAVSKTALNDWSTETLRNQSEQQLQMQPSIAESFDQLPTVGHPSGRSSNRDQTYSEQQPAPSAPANLPFPTRPGSLFQ